MKMKMEDYLMNRDEARSRITADIVDGIEYMSEENVYELINNIYDDFEKDLKEFQFTSCDDCKNKIDGIYQEICSNCKRFYGCYFEAKKM